MGLYQALKEKSFLEQSFYLGLRPTKSSSIWVGEGSTTALLIVQSELNLAFGSYSRHCYQYRKLLYIYFTITIKGGIDALPVQAVTEVEVFPTL